MVLLMAVCSTDVRWGASVSRAFVAKCNVHEVYFAIKCNITVTGERVWLGGIVVGELDLRSCDWRARVQFQVEYDPHNSAQGRLII